MQLYVDNLKAVLQQFFVLNLDAPRNNGNIY